MVSSHEKLGNRNAIEEQKKNEEYRHTCLIVLKFVQNIENFELESRL